MFGDPQWLSAELTPTYDSDLFIGLMETLEVASELDLAEDLVWSPTRQGIYIDGAVRPLNTPRDLLANQH